jgi:hypothetical protein
MKRLLYGAVWLLFFPALSFAQFKSNNAGSYSDLWNPGYVVFHTGDTVHCQLRFNPLVSEGLLQAKHGDEALTLMARDVRHFLFFDSLRNDVRSFYSMPVADESRRYSFLECLYRDHKFSILLQRKFDVVFDYMNFSRFISKVSSVHRPFILNQSTGELVPLSKAFALRLLQHRREEVDAYIEARDLKFKHVVDYIEVFQYHSTL